MKIKLPFRIDLFERLAFWWHSRRDPVCRIIDLAQELSSEEMQELEDFFRVSRELTEGESEAAS